MLHCKERESRPCFHYDSTQKQHLLNEFLTANGGAEAEFLRDGTAIISSLVKGIGRLVYLCPTAWIRVIAPCQFSAVSDRTFSERFEVIPTKPEPVEPLPQPTTGVLAGLDRAGNPATSWMKALGIGTKKG